MFARKFFGFGHKARRAQGWMVSGEKRAVAAITYLLFLNCHLNCKLKKKNYTRMIKKEERFIKYDL